MANNKQGRNILTVEQAIKNYIKPARELARELAAACETGSGEQLEQLKKRGCYLAISVGWAEVLKQSRECKDLATLYGILEDTMIGVESIVDFLNREYMYMVADSFNGVMRVVMDSI